MSAAEPATSKPECVSTVDVSRYDEVREAWRCPHLSAGLSGPGEEHFHLGTIMRLDGTQHAQRRKIMGSLLSKRGHEHFRKTWLFPAADAALARVLAHPDADGVARVDLLKWVRRVNQQLAAALTGLDGATDTEGASALFDLMEIVLRGRPRAFEVTLGAYDPRTAAARNALEARREIVEKYYRPSLARRRDLVARVAAGELTPDDLPLDLVTLIAQGADPAWLDPAMGEREALFLLAAAVHTTSSALIWALREIYEWLDLHPQMLPSLSDEGFILRAAQETLRLHPVVPGFPRLATQDVELKGGTRVAKDEVAILRSGPASTATDVFGENALQFDPDRTVPPGVSRYALAFGMGPHMCFGMPIVLGTGGMDGSLVYLLKKVLDAGARPDPRQPPFNLATTRGTFATDLLGESYLVEFAPPAAAS